MSTRLPIPKPPAPAQSVSAPAQPQQVQKSPKEVRQDQLSADRDTQAISSAQNLYTALVKQANVDMKKFLNQDKQAASLRASLQTKAKSAVAADIDKADGLEANERADAKLYTEDLVAKDNTVSKTLEKYAKQEVDKKLPSDKEGTLKDKFISGYNKTLPKPEIPLDKQKEAAKKQADKEAAAEAARMISESHADMKKDILAKLKQGAGFLDSTVDVGDLGKKEADKRHGHVNKLVKEDDIKTIYTNKLFVPIKEAVVMKLGVGRGAWRRSKELNELRKGMKDTAWEETSTGIDKKIDENLAYNSKDLQKKFTGMMAKTEAKAMYKGSVDKAMVAEADVIVKTVLPEDSTKKLLKEAAETSAYHVARTDIKGEKVNEAALLGASKKAIELLKLRQTEAVEKVRLLTKGDKAKGIKPDAAQVAALKEKTKKQVEVDDIAGLAITKTVDAPTLSKGLVAIAKVLDLAAPNIGDSSSFNFDLKIPAHASGVYILFGFAGSVGREDKELTMAAEITFGIGFQTFGLDANFRAGIFLESIGKDSTSVMNLTSYGMYRQIRNISDRAADSLWGMGGKSGMQELEEAEVWAAMIEQQELMKKGNQVDIGLMFKGQADINAGVAEMGGALGYKNLGRFNKEAIEKLSPGNLGETTDLTKLKEKAAALGRGMTVHVIEASGEASVDLGGNKIAFGLEAAGSRINNRLRSIEIKASGSIPFQFGEDAEQAVKIISKIVTPVGGAVKNLVGVITSKMKDSKVKDKDLITKGVGSALDTGTDLLFIVPQFEDVGKSLAASIKGDETINDTIRGFLTNDNNPGSSAIKQVNKVALVSSLDLSIGFSNKWNDKGVSTKGWEIALEVSQTKSFEVDAGIVNVAVEKSKRLGKLQLERKGGVNSFGAEVAGIEL